MRSVPSTNRSRRRIRGWPAAAWRHRPPRYFRFLLSGGLATLLHWSVMGVLSRADVPPLPATTFGAVAGSLANYLLQSRWTFESRGAHGSALPAYAGAVMAGWMANAAIFHSLASLTHAGLAAAQLFTTVIVAIMNFVMYKRIVFHERTDRTSAS